VVGFFYLKSGQLVEQRAVGEKIMEVIKDVGDESPGSEWKAFKADPKAWLSKYYDYRGPGAGPNGEIPASLKLVPVYDTEDTMHVRIPWKGVLDGFEPDQIPDREPGYGTGRAKLPILMARYFMRKCR
jgi:hypothetical protein